MKKRASTVLPLAAMALVADAAHAQDQTWGVQIGSPENDAFFDCVPDGADGAFICGHTFGLLGDEQFGSRDCVVGRFDAQGDPLWIRQFGSDQQDWAFRVAYDGASGVYVSGRTEGDLGGENQGMRDSYVARFDADTGEEIWIRQFGTPEQENLRGLTTDGAGGVFVAGTTDGKLGDKTLGQGDAVLARFDSEGVMSWIVQFGTPESDTAYALASDGAGGVFVGGSTAGDLQGPNQGESDVFIARYDADGARIGDGVQFGDLLADLLIDLEPDGTGGVLASGIVNGLADESDGWAKHLDSNLAEIWGHQVDSGAYDELPAIAPLGGGEAVVAGSTMGSLGPKGPFGQGDAIVARYDAEGAIWIDQFGTIQADQAYAICSDGASGTYVVGYTRGDLFDESSGESDAFIARYACPADMNADGDLNILDFVAFQTLWQAQDAKADCDGSKSFDVLDFVCYQGLFQARCP